MFGPGSQVVPQAFTCYAHWEGTGSCEINLCVWRLRPPRHVVLSRARARSASGAFGRASSLLFARLRLRFGTRLRSSTRGADRSFGIASRGFGHGAVTPGLGAPAVAVIFACATPGSARQRRRRCAAGAEPGRDHLLDGAVGRACRPPHALRPRTSCGQQLPSEVSVQTRRRQSRGVEALITQCGVTQTSTGFPHFWRRRNDGLSITPLQGQHQRP